VSWNPQAARQRSRALVETLRFPQPPDWYPVIDRGTLRHLPDIQNRALVLNVVINCAFGMPTDHARAWLGAHGLIGELTGEEADHLAAVDAGLAAESQGHRLRVEALWLLAWSLSLTPTLDWSRYCGDEMSSWLPDLRTGEDPARFRAATAVRAEDEILDEVDLAYCLTWGCAQSNVRHLPDPGEVGQYVMWERRRALEWLIGEDWDNPDLST
jgi:Domain of unknown function (DUF4272)